MFKMIMAFVCSLAVSAAFVAPSHAQESSNQPTTLKKSVAKTKEACKSDVQKFCKDVTPGEGRVAECLDSHEDQLSQSCKSSWTNTKASVSQFMDKSDVAFRKACGADTQKFCSEIPSGRGRILSCLSDHKADLSSSCQKFQANLDSKLAEYIG